MSKLNDLINELCPDGVEYKRLGDITLYTRGKGLSKDDKDTGDERIILYGELYTTYDLYIDDIVSRASSESVSNSVLVEKGDLLLPISSTTKEAQIGRASVLRCSNAYLGGDAISLRPFDCVDSSFLMYLINGYSFEKKKMKCVKGTTIRHLDTKALLDISIPVPPLEVQREIVHVLDAFTLLTAELTAELTARKKQYERYRDKLLSFDSDTPTKRLRDIVDFRNGKGHEKDIVNNGKYIVVNSKFISTNGEVRKYSDRQICPLYENDILMVMSDLPHGRALAKCFLVEENDKYSLNQRIGAFHVRDDSVIQTRFLLHILNRNHQLLRFDNGVDQTNLKKDDILDIHIPIPDIKKQDRIVRDLDNFESICFDLSMGLPAEIEARQKQYEYYRDRLLSFKEIGA